MRTWNLVLISVVLIVGMAASTAEAQRFSRPLLDAPVYPRISQPRIRSAAITNNIYPYVIARPEDRQWIRDTPIDMRPNRPMHFWGNNRRRTLR